MQIHIESFFERMCKTIALLTLGLSASSIYAGIPVWSFEPQTPVNISITKEDKAQVVYSVHNHSSKSKTLLMKPIAGISQATPCQLPARGICTLTLNVNGGQLQGDVIGGPLLCEQGTDLQCYQPSKENVLRIRLTEQPLPPPPIQEFIITPSAGANGTISPATPQVATAGSTLTFTALPDIGYGVSQWLLDGVVVQNGGVNYQLNNIQSTHDLTVTFGQGTLSPSVQSLTLSLNDSNVDPILVGNPRIIRIQNTGSAAATGLQVTSQNLPSGTLMTGNTCIGTLAAGATCDITITPGSVASTSSAGTFPCTDAPGTEPIASSVSVSADFISSPIITVFVLGYGCVYQGGFLFAVDDTTPNTQSIAGKVAALTDQPGPFFQWATGSSNTQATSTTNGQSNTALLATPLGQFPAAQNCIALADAGFTDWYLPAICELGRYTPGFGVDAGCGDSLPTVFNSLFFNGLGNLTSGFYWSSSQFSVTSAYNQDFAINIQSTIVKTNNTNRRIRCIRAFTS